MFRKLLRAKIHQARVTQCDPDYVGSITIDPVLLRAVDIAPNEAVWCLNIDNAARFETYVIPGEEASGIIGVNGAAAKLVEKGHKLIIVCYAQLQPVEIDDHTAKVVVCDQQNNIIDHLNTPSNLAGYAISL